MTVPLRLTIDLDALAANWRWFAEESAPAVTGAAVKANGYGIGVQKVVDRLAQEGCRDFFFTTYDEIEAFGAIPDGCTFYALHGFREGDVPRRGVVPVLNTPGQAARWKEAAPGERCDVKVDTGMNRLGFAWQGFGPETLSGLTLGTLHSHLACADEPGNPMNALQLSRFQSIVDAVQPPRASFCSSGGICLGSGYHFGLTRPGLGIYGGVPNPGAEGHVRSVIGLSAEVLQVRSVEAGETAGYGATWTAADRTRLATLNIGYADGYLRGFSSRGRIRFGGETYPVVGLVSMDMIIADIGKADIREGDWVDIAFDLKDASQRSGISQYELLTGLGHRYQRIYK